MSRLSRWVTRERFLAACMLLLLLAFAARLVQFQVLEHAQWKAIAGDQWLYSVYQKPSRGEIRDRNGMALAVTLPLTYAMGYRPVYALNFDALATILSEHLSRSKREIRERLDAPGFVYLARRVDREMKQKLDALHLGCLQFDQEPRRSYPSTTSAATVLGFTNIEGQGVEGVEVAMNDELSGEGYRELCRVDALREAPSLITAVPVQLRGADIMLTIDLQLQSVVDEKLREGLAGRKCDRACAILADPRTGDILALSTLPSFDPNQPGEAPAEHRRCWPVTDVFEPGSTMKIVPVAKALESGRYQRTSQIFCENGRYAVRGAVINDAHRYGTLSLDEVLARSSNIGAAKVCCSFSPSEIYDKIRAFGFGNRTLVGLWPEQAGQVPLPAQWSGPTQATLAYGHGVSCTALQMVMAYAAVANGGILMKPRLVLGAQFPSGVHREYPTEVVRRATSPEVAESLKEMLVGAVEYGTGIAARIEGLRIAGKTGTATKVDHERKRYFEDRYISSFVGFFPADDPKYVLLVTVDDPRGEYYGGLVAAPVFKLIVSEMLVTGVSGLERTAPANSDLTARPTHQTPRQRQATVQFATLAPLTKEIPQDDSRLALASDSTTVIVPFVEGWPLRRATQELSERNLGFRLFGRRVVVTQYPPAGTRVPAGTICELYGITG